MLDSSVRQTMDLDQAALTWRRTLCNCRVQGGDAVSHVVGPYMTRQAAHVGLPKAQAASEVDEDGAPA